MRRLARDGVWLAFEDAGRGSPPLLLVHGWACDHTYLEPQLAHFRANHRVVTVDLRGHGASDTPDQAYTMEGFAADLAWLCAELGLHRPVIVGHSMGAVIALELLRLYPDVPGAIVALDAPMVMPARRLELLRARIETAFAAPDFAEGVRDFVAGMFQPSDDPAHRARIVQAMASGRQHVLTSSFRALLACPSAAAATAAPMGVPLLAVASAAGHTPDVARLQDLCPQLTLAQTSQAGHFLQLEAPDEVNAHIERFLQSSPSIHLSRPLWVWGTKP